MRVKICGILNLEEAIICEDLGADAIGLVHFPGRRRSLDLTLIRDIAGSVGPFMGTFLVCAPSDQLDAHRMLDIAGTDGIQLYSLDPSDLPGLRECGYRVIKRVPLDRREAERYADYVDALVFESGKPGTGSEYDYDLVPMDIHPRTIIAGGLRPENIEEVRRLRPYGVDVSSGVEGPGGKDPGLVREFIRRCKA